MVASWRGCPSKKVPREVKRLAAMLDMLERVQACNREQVAEVKMFADDNKELAVLVARADIEIDLMHRFFESMAVRFGERSFDENLAEMASRDVVKRLIDGMRRQIDPDGIFDRSPPINPRVTLADLMKKRGLSNGGQHGGGSGGAATPGGTTQGNGPHGD